MSSFVLRGSERRRFLLIAVGLFLTVVGARWVVIAHYGSDVPYWDQWGSEAEVVLTLWLQRGELWSSLYAQHSEHRILPTKALNLELTLLGGQWDARVQCVTNACLLAALATSLFIWTYPRCGKAWSLGASVILTLLLSLPLAVENILGGFQSQFCFLMGFSLLAIFGFISAPAFSLRWVMSCVTGIFALVSMGSGFLFALPVAFVTACRLLRAPRERSLWITLVTSLLLAAVGWGIRPHAPWQDGLHAQNARDFLLFLVHCLAWPAPEWPWLLALFWLPWFVSFGVWLRSDFQSKGATHEFVIAGGGWILLQLAAASYARGLGGGMPPNRYFDLLSLGLFFSFLGVAVLHRRQRISWWPFVGVACGIATIVAALFCLRQTLAHDLPDRKRNSLAYERNIQAYLLTGDFSHLNKAPVTEIPLFAGDVLERILRPPELRRVMATSVRVPVPVAPAQETAAFREQGYSPETPALRYRRVWGSYRQPDIAEASEWRSAVIPASQFAYWKFEIAGDLAEPGLSLRIVSARTGAVLTDIMPYSIARDSWRTVYVNAPGEPAVLVARDLNPHRWFAFSEPVEVGWLPYWARKLAKYGWWPLGIGLATMLIVGIATLTQQSGHIKSLSLNKD